MRLLLTAALGLSLFAAPPFVPPAIASEQVAEVVVVWQTAKPIKQGSTTIGTTVVKISGGPGGTSQIKVTGRTEGLSNEEQALWNECQGLLEQILARSALFRMAQGGSLVKNQAAQLSNTAMDAWLAAGCSKFINDGDLSEITNQVASTAPTPG